jgi:hypothetical protein
VPPLVNTLRELIDLDGRKPHDIARAAGCSRAWLLNVAAGRVALPAASRIVALASAIGRTQQVVYRAWRISRILRLTQHPEERRSADYVSGVVLALKDATALCEAVETRPEPESVDEG